MLILDYIKAYKGLITFLAIIFGPRIVPRVLARIVNGRRNPHLARGPPSTSASPAPPPSPAPVLLKALLLVSTAYHIVQLIHPPFDLFSALNIPTLVPNSVLRAVYTSAASPSPLSSPSSPSGPSVASRPSGGISELDELLLQKLASYDNRINYARFGHSSLLNCLWCDSKTDYAMYALPSILAPYVLSAIFIGFLGFGIVGGEDAGRRAEKWRATAGCFLLMGAIGEMGLGYFSSLRPVNNEVSHVRTSNLSLD